METKIISKKYVTYTCAAILAMGAVLCSTGCSSASVFKNYPSQVNPVINRVKKNEPLKEPLFVKQAQGKDKTLYLMERGRVEQLFGDVGNSRSDYDAALAAIRENDEKAKVSASGVAAQATAVLLNDNAIPYEAAGYERVLLRYSQAVNYLSAGDLNGARVEISNADAEQKDAEEKHAKAIEKATKDSEDKALSVVTEKYAGLDEIAGKVKNSFQNGAAYYLSGLIYESLGDRNNAYISYKQALEIFPENKTLQRDVSRIATRDSRLDDLAEFKSRFNLAEDEIKGLVDPEGYGRIIVLYEDGFIAQKKEIKIPIPMINPASLKDGVQISDLNGVVFIAFPIYDISWVEPSPLSIKSGDVTGETMPLCYVNALAVKSLKEKIPAMVVRQVARAAAKAVATKVASDQGGTLGMLAASAVGYATENADLRSWLTLPQDIQVCRTALPAGDHQLMLSTGGGAQKKIDIKVEAGKTTFVHVVGAGANLLATTTTF